MSPKVWASCDFGPESTICGPSSTPCSSFCISTYSYMRKNCVLWSSIVFLIVCSLLFSCWLGKREWLLWVVGLGLLLVDIVWCLRINYHIHRKQEYPHLSWKKNLWRKIRGDRERTTKNDRDTTKGEKNKTRKTMTRKPQSKDRRTTQHYSSPKVYI